MKKFLLCFILFIYPQALNGHVSHYKNIKKIEMEIFKDGKNIGFCNYEMKGKVRMKVTLTVKMKVNMKV